MRKPDSIDTLIDAHVWWARRERAMAYWLHSDIGEPELYPSRDEALAALNKLVAKLVKQGYSVTPVKDPEHFRLAHKSEGYVEAYIDMEGPENDVDDEVED